MSTPVRRQKPALVPLDQPENAGIIRARLRGNPHPLQAAIGLWVEVDPRKPLVCATFIVDSGASYSQITSHEGATLGLNIPAGPEIDCFVNSAAGRRAEKIRPSLMKVWWTPQRDGDPFEWPLLFRMMSDVPDPPAIRPVLGLGGVVTECRWTFDGTYSYERVFGALALEDIR